MPCEMKVKLKKNTLIKNFLTKNFLTKNFLTKKFLIKNFLTKAITMSLVLNKLLRTTDICQLKVDTQLGVKNHLLFM